MEVFGLLVAVKHGEAQQPSRYTLSFIQELLQMIYGVIYRNTITHLQMQSASHDMFVVCSLFRL